MQITKFEVGDRARLNVDIDDVLSGSTVEILEVRPQAFYAYLVKLSDGDAVPVEAKELDTLFQIGDRVKLNPKSSAHFDTLYFEHEGGPGSVTEIIPATEDDKAQYKIRFDCRPNVAVCYFEENLEVYEDEDYAPEVCDCWGCTCDFSDDYYNEPEDYDDYDDYDDYSYYDDRCDCPICTGDDEGDEDEYPFPNESETADDYEDNVEVHTLYNPYGKMAKVSVLPDKVVIEYVAI